MRTSIAATIFFAVTALAGTLRHDHAEKRQEAITFNEISISGGVAGNAQQEAIDALSDVDPSLFGAINSICNEAEDGAFNVALEDAEGEEADALQRGKIKNKVLKITATLMKFDVEEANGEDVADERAAEEKKLANNVAQDEAEAGKESTNLDFDAVTN